MTKTNMTNKQKQETHEHTQKQT